MTILCINLQLCFRLWFLFDTFKSISYIIKPLLHYTNNSNHNFCSVCNNTPSAWLFFSRMLIRWPLFYGLIFESLNLMITIVFQYQCTKASNIVVTCTNLGLFQTCWVLFVLYYHQLWQQASMQSETIKPFYLHYLHSEECKWCK